MRIGEPLFSESVEFNKALAIVRKMLDEIKEREEEE